MVITFVFCFRSSMDVSGISLVVLRTVMTAVFRLIWLIFSGFQRIKWALDGTASKIKCCDNPENYDACVQVLDIIVRYKFDILDRFSTRDFICVHNRFESPDFIFANDSVSLLTVNEASAVFIEARKPDMQLWKSKYSAFIRNAQLEFGQRLLIVPRAAYHRMSQQIGEQQEKMVFLFNTGRCGSTLLTQMFEYTGTCVAVSEPDALNVLACYYRKRGDSEQLRTSIRDTVRWICRPYKSFQQQRTVVKLTSVNACAMHLFADMYPNSSFLYMYRDTLKLAQSCYRVSLYLPSLYLMFILGKYSAVMSKICFDSIGFAGEDYRVKLYDNLTFGVLMMVRTATPYLELYRKGFKIAAVRYEDVVADPLTVCQRLLKFCGLPESLAEKGIESIKFDSQVNTPVSQDLSRRHGDPVLTPASKQAANQLLVKYGLPEIGEECFLEGTISKL